MMGHPIWQTDIATRINEIEPSALLTQCHGHALQLANGDTIKAVKLMRGELDTALELNKIIIYSPKKEGDFNRLRKQIAPGNSDYRTLLPSILDNWAVFPELWDKILEGRVDSEVWFQVKGINANTNF